MLIPKLERENSWFHDMIWFAKPKPGKTFEQKTNNFIYNYIDHPHKENVWQWSKSATKTVYIILRCQSRIEIEICHLYQSQINICVIPEVHARSAIIINIIKLTLAFCVCHLKNIMVVNCKLISCLISL